MKRVLVVFLGALFFVAALVVGWNLGAANATTIDIDLLWIKLAEVTVWQLGLAAFAVGAGLVLLMAGFLGTRGWLLRRRYRATIRRLESELHQMRSLPLAADGAGDTIDARAPDAEASPRVAQGGA